MQSTTNPVNRLAIMTTGRRVILLGDSGKWFREGAKFAVDARSKRRGVLAVVQDGAIVGTVAAENEAEIKAANDGGHLALGYVNHDEIMIHKINAVWLNHVAPESLWG